MTTESKPRIFSVGYENLTQVELAALVHSLDVTLIDVRSTTAGRVKRGFSRDDLTAALGARYEWRKELGGRGAGPTSEGLQKLAEDPRRLLLMCMEAAPGDCHRHHAIALRLIPRGLDVWHVCEDEVVRAADLQRAIEDDDEYEYRPLEEVLAEVK